MTFKSISRIQPTRVRSNGTKECHAICVGLLEALLCCYGKYSILEPDVYSEYSTDETGYHMGMIPTAKVVRGAET